MLEITNEDEAWLLFEKLQNGESVDLSNGVELNGWPTLNVYVKSGDASISTDMMEAFLEYQEMIYRSASLILRGTSDLRRQTSLERENLTFRVKVSKGSTNSDVNLGATLSEIVKSAVGNMSPEQTVFVVISLGLMATGVAIYKARLNSNIQGSELQEKKDQRRDFLKQQVEMSKTDLSRARMMAGAIKDTAILSQIDDLTTDAALELFALSSREGDAEIAGVPISEHVGDVITRAARRKSEKVNFSGVYKINKIDATAKKGFRAQLKNIDTDQVLTAGMADILVVGDAEGVVKSAFWAKREIHAELQAKEIGEEVVDAEILKAKAVKKNGTT